MVCLIILINKLYLVRVLETVEESSTCKTIYDMEIKKLYGIIQQLETENQELKTEKQQSPQHSTQVSSKHVLIIQY